MPARFSGADHGKAETGHEGVNIVLEGSGTLAIEGEAVAVTSGDYLRVDAETTRQTVAGAAGLTFGVKAAKPRSAYDGRLSS